MSRGLDALPGNSNYFIGKEIDPQGDLVVHMGLKGECGSSCSCGYPHCALAQQAGKVYRIGFLDFRLRSTTTDPRLVAFRQGVARAWVC